LTKKANKTMTRKAKKSRTQKIKAIRSAKSAISIETSRKVVKRKASRIGPKKRSTSEILLSDHNDFLPKIKRKKRA
jgi:hypothetical protein